MKLALLIAEQILAAQDAPAAASGTSNAGPLAAVYILAAILAAAGVLLIYFGFASAGSAKAGPVRPPVLVPVAPPPPGQVPGPPPGAPAATAKVCAGCGKALPPTARFCVSCGTPSS